MAQPEPKPQTNPCRLGDLAPEFEVNSTQGQIKLSDYCKDSWVILFSHPKDFTPICATELAMANKMNGEFNKRNCKLLAYSVDSVEDHLKWIEDLKILSDKAEFEFPILEGADRKIGMLYGMLDPNDLDKAGLPLTIRSVFIIDPNRKIRLKLTYPAATGRNFDELIRVLDSLQMTDDKQLATPANWKMGEPAACLPSLKSEDAEKKYGPVTVQEGLAKEYLRFVSEYQKKAPAS